TLTRVPTLIACSHFLAARLCILLSTPYPSSYSTFFFNDTPPTEIYTLSLHDALPILRRDPGSAGRIQRGGGVPERPRSRRRIRRSESTRLNSSHQIISYAVFCLKKKKKKIRKKKQNKKHNRQTDEQHN